jgi:hypothetical protein
MAEFRAFSSRVEVMGAAVLSIVGGMDVVRPRALQILEESGIAPLDAARWYPQQRVLNVFKAVFETVGPQTVRAIGRKIPETAEFPPELDSLEMALRSIDVAYRMNHRGAEHMGSYRYEQLGARHAQLACHNPYPCDMDMGLIEGVAMRFRPKDSGGVTVEHLPGKCRSNGDLSCTYSVKW